MIFALQRSATLLAVILACTSSPAISSPDMTRAQPEAADDLQRIVLDYGALIESGPSNDALPDRNASAIAARYDAQAQLLRRLKSIDPRTIGGTPAVTYTILVEMLGSLQGLQVCRTELWDLNHITGWQIRFPSQIASQPVASASEREGALRRWSSLPEYISTDIDNLRSGIANGYAVPKTVVNRVLQQLDALLGAGADDSPLLKPALNTDDVKFQADWHSLVAQKINPSLRGFEQYLRTEYVLRARDSIGISALPDGKRCYAAFLTRATTLDRSPSATFALGQSTIAQSRAELKAIGKSMFDTTDVREILRRAKAAKDNRFSSPQDLLAYSQAMLQRSEDMSAAYFFNLPQQAIEIAPMPNYQRGSGISSHYEAAESRARPAFYRIDVDDWAEETRGAAAVTVVHETIPGHHLQATIARTLKLPQAVAQNSFNSAYVEGWANYIEGFCEEAGFYDNPYAQIFRRSVLGESLMIDPAIHVMGWSRERARKELEATGQTASEADDIIDRIAVQPGQLTSYETGGLEILNLREQAKRALGKHFDIREFHQRILEQGDVPLSALRQHVLAWIETAQKSEN